MTEESLFLAALERPTPAERQAFLEQACGQDVALRARVQVLLEAHARSRGILEARGAPPPGALGATIDPADGPLEKHDYEDFTARAGAILAGKYKLVEEIGEGGMGSVFMAQQTEPVKRAVAVKVIKAGMDSKAVLARFEAERQALAMMDHPNIAKVLDAGATDAGRPFFVMELVKGTPITRYCDEHKLTPRQRLELFVPVCQAIQHAHQKGIIHRDIKPSNVLVAMYDDRAAPKVIDFGVAKAVGQSLTEKTLMTGFGALVGTPEYMSPEQATLNNLDIDTRSDVYSLGVLLYELLTGSTPVDKKSLDKAALLELLRIVREVEAPRPSTKLSAVDTLPSVAANRGTEPAKLPKLMKGELDWLVMKALEKDRARRNETASALSRDIQRYLANEMVEARPPSVGYRASKFIRRHKGQMMAASLVLLVLICGIVSTTLGLFEARRQEKIARDETAEKERALLAEADRVKERDAALKLKALALAEQKQTAAELQRSLYFSRIHLAHRELAANNIGKARDLLDKCPPELRHWEWRYLKRLSHTELLDLQHPAEVWSVAFSPDGQRLVSSCSAVNAPSEVKLWDASSGKELSTLSRHGKPVICTAFSPDGKYLASASIDKVVQITDVSTGKEVKSWSLPAVAVQIAFTSNGKSLATALSYPDGRLMLWNPATGLEAPMPFDMKVMGGIAFSPDGQQLAVVTAPDNRLKLYDVASGAVSHVAFSDHEGLIARVAFSADGQHFAGASSNRISIWDVKTGEEIQHLVSQSTILNAAFSPDLRRLAFATSDHSIQIWDSAPGRERLVRLVTLRGHSGLIGASPLNRLLAFSPDGLRLASGSLDRTVKIWDATQNPEIRVLHDAPLPFSVAFSRDGRRLAIGKAREVLVLDPKTGAQEQSLGSSLFNFSSAAFGPDGKRVAAVAGFPDNLPAGEPATLASFGITGGALRIWDADTGEETFASGGTFGIAPRLAFGPERDMPWLAVAGGGFLRIWDAAAYKLLHTLPNSSDAEGRVCVGFSSDGRFVAGGGGDEIKLWVPQTGKLVHSFRGHGQTSSCLAFQPRAARLAVGGYDRQVRIWDADKGTLLHNLGPHPHLVSALAYSADGRRLTVAGGDTVKLWDTDTGDEMLTLRTPRTESVLSGVAFSPDGSQIVATDIIGGAVVAWEAVP